MDRARSWTGVIEQLYDGAWNGELQRFRSPFAFRGHPSLQHDLSTSLVRLAGGRSDITTLELSLIRNFRKYAHRDASHGIDSIWHWLAVAQHHGLPTRLFALFSMMSNPAASLDHWVRAHPHLCRAVVVPAELKWEIRDKLDQANINERTLFPGLDGSAGGWSGITSPKSGSDPRSWSTQGVDTTRSGV